MNEVKMYKLNRKGVYPAASCAVLSTLAPQALAQGFDDGDDNDDGGNWDFFIGAGVSWFLTLVSIFEIGATCEYCLASFALMNLLLALVLLRRPAGAPEREWRKVLPFPVGAAVVLVLGLHLHFNGVFDAAAGPEDPYLKALAAHLQESGARFYGAHWCRACREQKALFTASAKRLPYIECAPSGPNSPLTPACTIQDIQRFPTWVVNGKRLTGMVDVERLARASNFDRSAAAKEAAPEG